MPVRQTGMIISIAEKNRNITGKLQKN